MKVDTPAMIDALRKMCTSEQHKASRQQADVERIRAFNDLLLCSVRRHGRVHEFGLMGAYKLRTRDIGSDLKKLPAMLRKGKLRLLPSRTKGRMEVRMIFKRLVKARRAGS